MVTYFEGLLSIKLLDPLAVWSSKITSQTKSIIPPLQQCLSPPNLTGWWLTLRGSYYQVTWPFNIVLLRDHVTNLNHYISTTTIPGATKPNRMVTYLEEPPAKKSHDHFLTWSCKITLKIKYIISPLIQGLWLTNMARWLYIMRSFHP